jgi:hypothetical protein|tara:strand:+ start:288 stop:542 length:255 start_codon:yes stop_codon:yes gene_type:complete
VGQVARLRTHIICVAVAIDCRRPAGWQSSGCVHGLLGIAHDLDVLALELGRRRPGQLHLLDPPGVPLPCAVDSKRAWIQPDASS